MLTRLCILARGYSSLGDCFSLVGGGQVLSQSTVVEYSVVAPLLKEFISIP